jgi:magnesium-protoporphyrin O-methyltransferase
MVDFLVGRGVGGASVLEVGGGVGELHVELLRHGAAQATNLELVPAYDTLAGQLAAEAGVADRVRRQIVDIATHPDEVGDADIVVMHRVVCCYPDVEELLGAAADHARRLLVFSHLPRNAVSRVMLGAENSVFRLSGKSFRTFAHPPAVMARVLESRGLVPVFGHRGLAWQVVGWERPAA